MDARTYEKLYGMRPILLLLTILVFGVCLFVIFSSSFMFRLFGQGEVVTVFPSQESGLATSTEIKNPTLTPVPATTTPNPTTQPSPTSEPPLATPTKAPNTPATGSSELIVCTGVKDGYLNFRIAPNSSVIGLLREGEHVTFINKADTFSPWNKIEVDGTQGYAYGAYLCNP